MSKLKNAVLVSEDEPGKTGAISPGKILGWFWTVVAIYISIQHFGYVPGPLEDMTFGQWITSSFVFGVMAAGFYFGMAKGAFLTVTDALKKRISGE